ncbi:adenylate/guanylate cyclase domain-containing protein [Leptolyngbyaceae cyanobacterium CCMR0082]|uniref:Adenylate/guanylate cyclase domain-containing protein n=2 Tax=Adonisia turfae TaxID=2950184 RepID=A0A6M0S787_9CYAN|nr:adenylate/guanylate cyclase domain-containing protein [Adonisia turfae]NEZ55941.1 adenylate/guanylate cyclase domain-containing protein [Adonisia turfae CCMR0081]NEZ64256.1 adenylate/guanylate cyclase domain-containing protein [Adonisia turfae CCMR0082]
MNVLSSNSDDHALDGQSLQQLAAENKRLRDLLALVQSERDSLEALANIVTEHSTVLENSLNQQKREMLGYIDQVKIVTSAAAAVQQNVFTSQHLEKIAQRDDELGNLAKVFTETVLAVKHHEQTLVETNQHLEQLLQAYSRFVPQELLHFLQKESVIDLQLGDHVSKEMAILFSDIRGFTTLAETMTPQENFNFINTYLGYVSPEIANHNGLIMKYMGDGLMAVFPDGVDDALQACIAQAQRLRDYNQHRRAHGHIPLSVGMGIHVGRMMVGIVGESHRMQGDALSDNVNLTARLEGLTKYYGVQLLVSEDVLRKLTDCDRYPVRLIDRAIVKGRHTPITVYEVLDAEEKTLRAHKLKTLPQYLEALNFYQQGQLTKAQACFEQVCQANPTDKTVQLYLERLQLLQKQGLPDDWQGIWEFTQK